MKPNTTEKKIEQKNGKNPTAPLHQRFKVGRGYGSSEPESEAREHPASEQYGDNPLPPSGGDYIRKHPKKRSH